MVVATLLIERQRCHNHVVADGSARCAGGLPGWLAALHREPPDVILAVEVTNSAKVLAGSAVQAGPAGEVAQPVR